MADGYVTVRVPAEHWGTLHSALDAWQTCCAALEIARTDIGLSMEFELRGEVADAADRLVETAIEIGGYESDATK